MERGPGGGGTVVACSGYNWGLAPQSGSCSQGRWDRHTRAFKRAGAQSQLGIGPLVCWGGKQQILSESGQWLGANVYTEGPAFLLATPSWTGSSMDLLLVTHPRVLTADTRLRLSILGSSTSPWLLRTRRNKHQVSHFLDRERQGQAAPPSLSPDAQESRVMTQRALG